MAKLQALNQCIHLRLCIIHGEAGAAGGADGEVIHEGLRAVLPRPHGDTLFVQNRGNVMGMSCTVEGERKNCALSG